MRTYDEVEAALKKCPGATLKGIDVSIYQGTIDWPKVQAPASPSLSTASVTAWGRPDGRGPTAP